MDTMGRIHGTGTFDHSTRKWKVRTKEVTASATVAQLSHRYGVDLPNDERKTRPYWNRYLAEQRHQHALDDTALRLTAAKIIYADREPEEYSEFERNPVNGEVQYRERLTPEVVRIINEANQGNYAEVKALVTKTPTVSESLRHEVTVYIDRHKHKNKKNHYEIRTALNLFLEASGDIGFRNITPQHYRDFLAKLDAGDWSPTTKLNRQRMIHTFLKRIEADYNVIYGFIRNPDYKRQTPEGQKVQYTLDEVRTALGRATGINRTALLLGLNIGAYWGDITELRLEHVVGNRIVKGRAKNRGKTGQVVGSWILWPETVEALQYGLTKWQLENAYAEFREKYALPEHKALRKTVAQWIQDNVGEVESRLYRGEGVGGTHGRNYIKSFSPEQVAKLDKALTLFREKVLATA